MGNFNRTGISAPQNVAIMRAELKSCGVEISSSHAQSSIEWMIIFLAILAERILDPLGVGIVVLNFHGAHLD